MRRAQSKRVRDAVSSHLGQRSIDAADLGTVALHEIHSAEAEAHCPSPMENLVLRPRLCFVFKSVETKTSLLLANLLLARYFNR